MPDRGRIYWDDIKQDRWSISTRHQVDATREREFTVSITCGGIDNYPYSLVNFFGFF